MILLMRIICDFSYLYSDIKKYLDLFLVANSERLTATLGKTKKPTPKRTNQKTLSEFPSKQILFHVGKFVYTQKHSKLRKR